MRKPTRVPVPAPDWFDKALKRSLKSRDIIDIEGISIHAPKSHSRTWRIRMHFNGRAFERTATGSIDDIYAAFFELRNLRLAVEAARNGAPENCFETVAEVLQRYIQQGGPTSSWKTRTMRDRAKDLRPLIEKASTDNLLCRELLPVHVRTYINDTAATALRGKHLRGIVLTFIKWGVGAGFFTSEQHQHISHVQWSAPKGSDYRRAKSRREQSQEVATIGSNLGGQVMTTEQLVQFAQQAQSRYMHGEGLIHVSAIIGTRAQETFMLTASPHIAETVGANLVDLDEMCVHVIVQVNDDPRQTRKTTKNSKRRAVNLPPVSYIPSGFDVRGWLAQRCQHALQEQQEGHNPLALIFPNADGGPLELGNFNARVIRPSADALGWKMAAYTDARGRARSMRRFTLHSLRDYFAVTAIQTWGYNPIQLLQQGSWTDLQTVNKYYLGTTDETSQTIKEIFNECK